MMRNIFQTLFTIAILVFGKVSLAAPSCLEVLAPANRESIFTTLEGEKMAVKIKGPTAAKKVVLFLNGIDRDMNQWTGVRDRIGNARPDTLLVQIDLFGQGKTSELSPNKTSEISFTKQVKALHEMIEAKGWNTRELTLVGHSYGAGIAARYVRDNPNQVKQAILIAPFVDNLEVYQAGVGPYMGLWNSWAKMVGGTELYDQSVSFGSEMAMISTWYSYAMINGLNAKLSDVTSLTRGIRKIEMTRSVQMAGSTQFHLIQSAVDEMIPATAHWILWNSIPDANRGSRIMVPSTHDSVAGAKALVANKIIEIIQ